MKAFKTLLLAVSLLTFVSCSKGNGSDDGKEYTYPEELEGEWVAASEMYGEDEGYWFYGDMSGYSFDGPPIAISFNNDICTMASLLTSFMYYPSTPGEVSSYYTRNGNNIKLRNGAVFLIKNYDKNTGILTLEHNGSSFSVHRKATVLSLEGAWESLPETLGPFTGQYIMYAPDADDRIISLTPYRISFERENCTLSKNFASVFIEPTNEDVTYKWKWLLQGERITLYEMRDAPWTPEHDGYEYEYPIQVSYIEDYNQTTGVLMLHCWNGEDFRNTRRIYLKKTK